MTAPALSTDTLAELIDRRHDCLRELLGLTRQQRALAVQGDVDALLAVLGRKQPFLEALQRIAAALQPFHHDDAERRTWADPARRAGCQRLWDECATMYDEIVNLERASEAVLREQRDQVGRQLHASHSTHQVHRAYLHGTEPSTGQTGNQLDLTEA
jgi:flagellar biosynthesis/type III secretory pathway chaperone